MSSYKPRLATLEKLREARRDERRAALAEAFRAEQVIAEHRSSVQAELAELRELQRAATAAEYLDVNRLLEAQRYEMVLRGRELELAAQESLLSTEVERRRLALIEADLEVRVLELLNERHRQAHRREALRRETRQLDESALLAHSRTSLADQA